MELISLFGITEIKSNITTGQRIRPRGRLAEHTLKTFTKGDGSDEFTTFLDRVEIGDEIFREGEGFITFMFWQDTKSYKIQT